MGSDPSRKQTNDPLPETSGPLRSMTGGLSIVAKLMIAMASSLVSPSRSMTKKVTTRGESKGLWEKETAKGL